jgi:hypothetical protein
MNDAESSKLFLSALARFSTNLAKSDIVIYGIAYDFLHFGSWTIELGNRHSRLLLQWDGKESLMACSESDVADSQAPRDWKQVVDIPVKDATTQSGIFEAAEKIVIEHART